MKRTFTLFLSVVAFLFSCKKDDEGPVSPGEADFRRYIAVGNSLTAGFTDNGLYREGQLMSFPNLLAKQFKRAGGGPFPQPLFKESQANGTGYLKLTRLDQNGPVIQEEKSRLAIRGLGADNKTLLLAKFEEPTNNLGVPGMKLADIQTMGYGANNPFGFNRFFERLLSAEQSSKTYLQVVAESDPTFFTCWIGSNDVLEYAVSGGLATTTSYELFSANLYELFNVLTANGAKGVTANLVDITSLPYFTTITVASLRARFNQAPLYIRTGTQAVREATDQDLVLLSADSIGIEKEGVPKGFSTEYPLSNEDVLDAAEVDFVQSRTAGYNELIYAQAHYYHIPVVDAKALFTRIKAGIHENGVMVNASYITGGAFSLDGVHLTPRGNAIVANEFIKTINARYLSRLPLLNIRSYGGVSIRPQ